MIFPAYFSGMSTIVLTCAPAIIILPMSGKVTISVLFAFTSKSMKTSGSVAEV